MKRVLAIAFAAISPLAVQAGDLSHTYVEGGVTRLNGASVTLSGDDVDYDGGYLRASVGLAPQWYGFGQVHRGSGEAFGFDARHTESVVGLGYAHALGGRIELLAELGYMQQDMVWGDYDGVRASTGVRTMLGARMEGWAKATYSELGNGYGRYSGQAGALFKVSDTWGITGEADIRSRESRYSLGVRASF